MANRAGGTVTKTREDTSGNRSATVTYPEAPFTVTYTDIPASMFRLLERAQDNGKVVDVDADTGNNITAVAVR